MSQDLLISTRKGLLHFAREETGYKLRRVSFLGENVTNSQVGSDGSWYASLNLGHFGVKLRRSTDEGATWTECAVPEYPAGETIAVGDGKPPAPATLKLVWVLENSPEGLLAGTAPGGLFRSTDAGNSWQLLRGLWDRPERSQWFGGGYDYPGIHSICVHPHDPRTIRVAVSCGGVWQTSDGGETWTQTANGMKADYMPPGREYDPQIQDVHRMVQAPSSPDRLWVQHHSGMYRSDDGGHNWNILEGVSPSVFGFAVAVHPHDPNVAWFVPAVKDECRVPVDGKLVVTRTRDGAKSFEALGAGLPQESAYHLIYRHGLDVDSSGTRLVIGSTTGGLWLSNNSGESWETVALHLPPIYAVRFI